MSKNTPVSLDDFEKFARSSLDRNALDYYTSGAQDMITLDRNQTSFDNTRILGHKISSPICIAPTAMQRMAHPDGECATARAAHRNKTCMILSSWSTTSIEDVASATNDSKANSSGVTEDGPSYVKWFQLYIYKDREVTRGLIERAQANGYSAIALTVDTPYLGRRLADIRNKFQLPPHLNMANFSKADSGKSKVGRVDDDYEQSNSSGLAAYVASQIDPTLNWSDVQWIKKHSKIPVLAKGILTAEDARLAVEAGIDGIIVSNHGGRQLDTVPATIDSLEEVVRAVEGKVEVYLDGGVRRGTDVFKALALGAKAVFLGRPVLWALSYQGEEGVCKMLDLINEEFRLAMALTGCCTINDIKRSHVETLKQIQYHPRL
ncbi:Hydroxyacid oxidase 1 [Mycoemilia scoparia]|uniref:Oxidase FUB9 n=1 Tax=Mycoemilia scoparia TaxID=417184 RepID=A0A9W8DVW7_9FUNG|nr:Hydroxyacid oxidase 1 [Mycoemilia scoparia]